MSSDAEKVKYMGERAKILIVDDDTSILEILSTVLKQEGYKAEVAQTGKKALKKCQTESFDIAIVDIKLPDMEGTKLLEMLNNSNPAMIRIVITGYPSLENAIQSLNTGADGYLIKPIRPERLLEQIEEQIERRQRAKLQNLLRNTGLSAYEAKIYLSLALGGGFEVRKVSMTSGVPRTKVYGALAKLIERGLVFESPREPRRFGITTPSEAFGTLIQTLKKELSEKASSLAELEKAISALEAIHKKEQSSEPLSIQKEDVWSIQGCDEIMRRASEMLSKAKTSVCAVTTEMGLVLFYKNLRKALDDLAEKGVRIQIKATLGPTNASLARELSYVYEVENVPVATPILSLCVDKNELLLAQLKTDNSGTESVKDVGLFSRSRNLCLFFSSLLRVSKQPDHGVGVLASNSVSISPRSYRQKSAP